MHRHLVTIEVGVERRTNQWVQLNGFTFNKFWLEGLNRKSVQRRGTVEEYWMTFQYIFEDIPYYRFFSFYQFLRTFYCFNNTSFDEFADNKWLEKFGSHIFGKTALMEFEFWTNYDHRTTRVVNPFTEKVLTETSLFTF